MIHQRIELDKYDWVIDVYYGVTHFNTDDIMESLFKIGCDGKTAHKAYLNLSSGDLNTGLTYSNYNKGRTVMVVGVTDSAEQFANSLTHETGHIVAHIGKAHNLDMYGEEVCYLAGKIAQSTFKIAKLFMCKCKCCSSKIEDML